MTGPHPQLDTLTPDPEGFQPLPADLNGAVAAAHAELLTLDLGGLDSKAALMRRLKTQLKLPSYFGHNWDALYDALSDPDTRFSSALQLTGWDDFQREQPGLAEPLRGVLLDAQEALHGSGVSLWLLG